MWQTYPLQGNREHHRELLSSCQYCSACSGIPPQSLVTSSLFCFGKQEAPLPQHWERQSPAVSQKSVSSFRLVFKSEVWLYQNIEAARHIGLLFVCCREACRQVLGVLLQILNIAGREFWAGIAQGHQVTYGSQEAAKDQVGRLMGLTPAFASHVTISMQRIVQRGWQRSLVRLQGLFW